MSRIGHSEGRSATAGALEFLALGTGIVWASVLMGRLPSWRAELGTFQALYVVAWLFFALALLRVRRFEGAPHVGAILLTVAVAARLAVIGTAPTLSDDIYRYVWEGRVALHGHDPYRWSPLAAPLEALRDATVFPRINHPELATIYPPGAIAGFVLVAALSPTVLAMKLWIVLHDVALVMILLAWMRERGQSPALVVAYAWCPLIVIEFAGSGHNDPTALIWLVLALRWADRRPLASSLALAAGVLVKVAPLVALPFLWRRWNRGARMVAAALIALGLGWYWFQTRGVDSGLSAYWRHWRNNELFFALLASAFGGADIARQAAVGVVAVIAAVLLFRSPHATTATRTVLGALVLLAPVVHPWYLSWALVLEPLRPSTFWSLFGLTVVLAYGIFAPPLAGRDFHLPLGWRLVEYGLPAVAALAVWASRRRSAVVAP